MLPDHATPPFQSVPISRFGTPLAHFGDVDRRNGYVFNDS